MSPLHNRFGLTMASLAPWWALLGFSALLCQAIFRLLPKALDGLIGATPLILVAYVLSVALMVYAEGYRGFQLKFSPRFARRALHIQSAPTMMRVLFAPLYAMALFDAPRRRLIASWTLLTMIVGLVVVVGQLTQPWRGIIDAGVVAGLTYGLNATIASFIWAQVSPQPVAGTAAAVGAK